MGPKNFEHSFKWNIPGLATALTLLNNVFGVADLLEDQLSDVLPVAGALILIASIVGTFSFGLWFVINIVQWVLGVIDRWSNADLYRFLNLRIPVEECIALLDEYRQGFIESESTFMGKIYSLVLELDELGVATPQIQLDDHHAVTFDLVHAPNLRGWLQYLNAILGFIRLKNLEGARELIVNDFEPKK